MISSRYIKISGNFEIPSDLTNGNDYSIVVNGGIISRTERPDEQGGIEVEYRFRPLTGEILQDYGKSIKMSDKFSNSQKLRHIITKVWGYDYDQTMSVLLANQAPLQDFIDKHKN